MNNNKQLFYVHTVCFKTKIFFYLIESKVFVFIYLIIKIEVCAQLIIYRFLNVTTNIMLLFTL